jgi:hypothetical protein
MAIIGKQTKFQFPERAVSVVLLIMATHAVAQLFEALRYRPESRGFDSLCCQWNFWLAYTVCPANNGTAFIKQKILLHTFDIFVPNTRQRWGHLHRSSKACLKSCNVNRCSSSVTPLWMSLMSLECSASGTCFTYGWRGGGATDAKSGE